MNPEKQGTKVAAHYQVNVGAGEMRVVIRLRLSSSVREQKRQPFGKAFDTLFDERRREADEFYQALTPPSLSTDAANVMRQAIAGMLWSKQFFFFDGDNWLDEHNSNPLHRGFRQTRNWAWFHMLNEDVISMPDKWVYPRDAAWDLAFHALPLSIADPDFAKSQMKLMLLGTYLHPTGQMPVVPVELQRREPAGPRVRPPRSSSTAPSRPSAAKWTSNSSKRRSTSWC